MQLVFLFVVVLFAGSGEKMNRQLAEISHATSLDNLTQLVAGLGNIKADLAEVSRLTEMLKSSARVLKKGNKVC